MAIDAFMLPAGTGRGDQLMALWHAPQGNTRGAVLYVHPFAEEMNKTRRMAALQARALAAAGYGVLQIDLKGCGDSSGEFGDATWADWLANVQTGVGWLREHCAAPLTLWGLRAGCLLLADVAAAAAQGPGPPCNFIFWQPTPSGAAVLRQFLRHAAAAAFLDGGGKGVVDKLRRQLAQGEAIEVGGYRVHPDLAAGLEGARLPAPARAGQVSWLDVSALATDGDNTQALNTASAAAAAAWRATASHFDARVIAGPPFWQTAEIETAPALIEATLAALAEPVPA